MDDYRLLVSLIDGTSDLVASILPDRTFEFVNRAWVDTLQYHEKEIDSLQIFDVLFPGSLKKFDEIISNVLLGHSVSNIELSFMTKAKDLVEVEGNLFPRMEGKKVVAAVGYFRDITYRNKVQKELMEAQSRIEFITDLMIHDLTNINQEILSLLEILLFDLSLPTYAQDLVQEGLSELEKASTITANVRRISGIDESPPEVIDWDLDMIVRDAVIKVEQVFPEKKINLKTDFSRGQYVLRADRYLPDIFYSLIHNSMKADSHSEVLIEIYAERLKHTPFLRIQVMDHGPGIPPEHKDGIFAKVHRRESVLGTGIGLSLVKALVENYGGHLNVEDRVVGDYSKGANFILLLRTSHDDIKTEEVK